MINPDYIHELIKRVRNGDKESYRQLMEIFGNRLCDSIQSWSRFQLGPPVDVKEVIQDTFVRAYGSFTNFTSDGHDSFFRWLCGIAKNVLAEKAKQNRKRSLTHSIDSNVDMFEASGASQSRILRRKERLKRLEKSLKSLKPEYREVLILSNIEGLTMKEIAKRKGCTPRRVKYLLACAISHMKSIFGETESLHLPDCTLDISDLEAEDR